MVTLVKVGIGVKVGRRNMTVAVTVGDGVSVLRGVGVIVAVGVDVGKAAAVDVEAAFEVCAMNVLTAPGIGVETDGAVNVGTQASIKLSAINHERIFVLRIDIFPPVPRTEIQITKIPLSLHNDGNIWIAKLAINEICHNMETLLAWSYCIKVNGVLLAGLQFREFYAARSSHFGPTQIFEIESCGHGLGSGVDNCPHNIEFSVWSENGVIKRSAANGATGILGFCRRGSSSSCCTGSSGQG
jgi:hypothetical protein